MSKQIRAKIGMEGSATGKVLIQQLYGLSQTAERIVFESIIRRSVKGWVTIDPRFALALACLTHDVKFKVPDQYQWPEHLYLAGLDWHSCTLIAYNFSQKLQDSFGLETLITLTCGIQQVEIIGPHAQFHHMLLSFDRAEGNSFESLKKRHKIEICPVEVTEIIKPFLERTQLDA